jgi:hypothetical protein
VVRVADIGGQGEDPYMPLHDLPDVVFESLPSGRAQVLTHGAVVDSDRWHRELASRSLPEPTGKLAGAGTVRLTRADVFACAETEPSPEASLQLLYASLAWGLGTKASRLTGRLDGLAKDLDGAIELLARAWQHVRGGADPQACYEDLIDQRGGGRIYENGPAFATKFLYFAHGAKTSPRCVILDEVVSKRLRTLGVWPNAAPAAWFPSTYADYCGLMGHWAEQAATRMGRDVAADEIEFALFNG